MFSHVFEADVFIASQAGENVVVMYSFIPSNTGIAKANASCNFCINTLGRLSISCVLSDIGAVIPVISATPAEALTGAGTLAAVSSTAFSAPPDKTFNSSNEADIFFASFAALLTAFPVAFMFFAVFADAFSACSVACAVTVSACPVNNAFTLCIIPFIAATII